MLKNSQKTGNKTRRCAYCGTESPIVWVHGHGQCAQCGINVEECCRGEQCEINSQERRKSSLAKGE